MRERKGVAHKSFHVNRASGFYPVSTDLLPEGYQLLGLLPSESAARARLENTQGDFDFHFIAHPEKRGGGYRTRAGDELVVIVDRRRLQAARA